MKTKLKPKYEGQVEIYCKIDKLDRQMEWKDKLWNATQKDGNKYIQNQTCKVLPSKNRLECYNFAGLIVHVADVRRWFNEGKISPIK